MLLNMAISLYTSRLILQVLGIDDYGIYNVVGGLVAMFTFMQSALTSATQRFLNYALGENNFHQTQITFSTSVYIHIFMAIIVLLLAESIGLWFFMKISNTRKQNACGFMDIPTFYSFLCHHSCKSSIQCYYYST